MAETVARRRLGWRRLLATALDYGLVVVCLGVLTLVGALARAAGVMPTGEATETARWVGQLVVVLLLTGPVTLWLAWCEAAPRGASPGKRLLGLRVTAAGGGLVPLPRSLLRSAVKVALPWELGHTAVWRWQVWPGDPGDAVSLVLVWVAYALLLVWLVSLFVGQGRTPYDRLAGTTVRAAGGPDRAGRCRRGKARAGKRGE